MGSIHNCFHFGSSHGNFDYMVMTAGHPTKAELHLHLEGTVDRETLQTLDGTVTESDAKAVWTYSGFAGFIDCFKFIAQRLRTPEDYATVTRRMMQNLAGEGVGYAEVTLAAGVILWKGMDFAAVWRAIREAQQQGFREWPVEIQWNLDAIRQFGAAHVTEVARLAAEYAGDGVISFGIGGDELRGPANLFHEAYRIAEGAGLHLTAHAGETDGPESIRAALDLGAERIGHGITAAQDRELMRTLREDDIPLEICITSNVKTGAVSALDLHPVRILFDAGVPITLNTDDPGIFDCTLANEFQIAKDTFGFSDAELRAIAENAWKYSFRKTTSAA